MFENLPRKLKNLAVIVLVLELALVVILTFLLLRTRSSSIPVTCLGSTCL